MTMMVDFTTLDIMVGVFSSGELTSVEMTNGFEYNVRYKVVESVHQLRDVKSVHLTKYRVHVCIS